MPYRDQPTAKTNSLDANIARPGILQQAYTFGAYIYGLVQRVQQLVSGPLIVVLLVLLQWDVPASNDHLV